MGTPQRKSSSSASLIKFANSPSQTQGNLTGAKRVVNDVLVTFYNGIQKWNEHYLNGVKVMKDVQNDGDEDSFQNSCEKLGIIVELMNKQIQILEECSRKLASLCLLYPGNNPVFLSWTHEDFVKAAGKILKAYSQETKTKQKISVILKEYPPQCKEFDALLVAWTQLVGIKTDDEMLTRAMIYEAEISTPWAL